LLPNPTRKARLFRVQILSGYDWLYGSVGAVLGFMLWVWVCSAAVLVGAVLNAELERQAMPEAGSASLR
jgi:membrane protein